MAHLVEEHLRPTQLSPRREMPSKRALYRFFRDLGDAAPACLILTLADGAAAMGPRMTDERWQGMSRYMGMVLSQAEEQQLQAGPTRLITGDDLMAELGLAPGPVLGRLLDVIDEGFNAGEIETREAALTEARRLLESWADEEQAT